MDEVVEIDSGRISNEEFEFCGATAAVLLDRWILRAHSTVLRSIVFESCAKPQDKYVQERVTGGTRRTHRAAGDT